MAISPPSDIVLDVANAVSPADLQTARAELRARAGAPAASAAGFAVTVPAPRLGDTSVAAERANNPYVKFEATVLQSFVQSMLPKEAESVYGQGLAGDMWKGMLAEHMADVMARRGGIGIADRLLAAHYKDGDNTMPVGPLSTDRRAETAEDKAVLSASLVDDIQRSILQALWSDDASAPTGATANDNVQSRQGS